MAERHVAAGERHIVHQHEIIDDLLRRGRDPAVARELLRTFQESLAMHLDHRDRIRVERKELKLQLRDAAGPPLSQRLTDRPRSPAHSSLPTCGFPGHRVQETGNSPLVVADLMRCTGCYNLALGASGHRSGHRRLIERSSPAAAAGASASAEPHSRWASNPAPDLNVRRLKTNLVTG